MTLLKIQQIMSNYFLFCTYFSIDFVFTSFDFVLIVAVRVLFLDGGPGSQPGDTRRIMESCHFGSRGRGRSGAGGQETGNGEETEFWGGGPKPGSPGQI